MMTRTGLVGRRVAAVAAKKRTADGSQRDAQSDLDDSCHEWSAVLSERSDQLGGCSDFDLYDDERRPKGRWS